MDEAQEEAYHVSTERGAKMRHRGPLWLSTLMAVAALLACGKAPSGGVNPAPAPTTTTTPTSSGSLAVSTNGATTMTASSTTAPTGTTRPPVIPVTPTTPAPITDHTSTPAPPADFAFAATPGTLALMQDSSATVTVATSIKNGFNSAVALSAIGQPKGVTVSFSSASIPAPGNGFSKATVNVGSSVAVRSYTITFSASGGGLTRTAPLSLAVSVFTGNCVSAKCGNLGTRTYNADIKQSAPLPTYVPQWLLYYPSADNKTGTVVDRYLLTYYPAGISIDSQYYLRACPTTSFGSTETCVGSGFDAGGKCVHRWAGIVEWDAPLVYTIKGRFNLTQAVNLYGLAPVTAAVNKWLGANGKYLTPPCSVLPCP